MPATASSGAIDRAQPGRPSGRLRHFRFKPIPLQRRRQELRPAKAQKHFFRILIYSAGCCPIIVMATKKAAPVKKVVPKKAAPKRAGCKKAC